MPLVRPLTTSLTVLLQQLPVVLISSCDMVCVPYVAQLVAPLVSIHVVGLPDPYEPRMGQFLANVNYVTFAICHRRSVCLSSVCL